MHTTNPIDVKIGLQIASIEVYLIGFFFDIHSAFKGRIRSNLATIHDQSRLNWMAIKSRTRGGGGDNEELMILLKNRLISSRFNQDLLYKGGRTSFYGKFSAKSVAHLIRRRRIDGRNRTIIMGHDPTIPRKSIVRSSSEDPDASTCHLTINRVTD